MSPALMVVTEKQNKGENEKAENNQYHKGVKQLIENGIQKVPKKYILPPSDRPTTTTIDEDPNDDDNNNNNNVGNKKNNLELPIIDFSELIGPNRQQALESLAKACEQYGFFQLVNHGISEEVVKKMKDVMGRFFNESYEERAKYMTSDFRAAVRYGTSFSQNQDSVFCWRDFLKLLCHPINDFIHHWPSSPFDLRKVAATYAEETKYLFLRLMEAILESLGIINYNEGSNNNNNNNNNSNIDEENDDIMKGLENGSQMMVGNLYPPCPEPELTLGMPPHSDYGFLTLLLQDEQVEGLQIEFQGKWVTVQPIPNAFVVNVGDHLEIYSNGKYKSVLHRVVVNSMKSRISVASLHSLPFNYIVKPSPKLIDEANPKLYADTDFDTFLAYVTTNEPKRKSFLDSRKLC